jgi:hypothetical protein
MHDYLIIKYNTTHSFLFIIKLNKKKEQVHRKTNDENE